MEDWERESNNLKRVKALFEKCNDDYIKFNRIAPVERLHPRPDICALLYLHQRFGGEPGRDAISAAGHDEVWLDWEPGKLFDFNEADALYLIRCGVRCGGVDSGFAMFV